MSSPVDVVVVDGGVAVAAVVGGGGGGGGDVCVGLVAAASTAIDLVLLKHVLLVFLWIVVGTDGCPSPVGSV